MQVLNAGQEYRAGWYAGGITKAVAVLGFTIMLGACSGTGAGQGLAANSELDCRKYQVTGTNLPKQVCRTKEAWDRIERVERQVVDEYGRQSRENATTLQPGSSRGQPTVL